MHAKFPPTSKAQTGPADEKKSLPMKIDHVKVLGIAAGSGAGKRGAKDGPGVLRDLGLLTSLANAGLQVTDLGDVAGDHATEYAKAAREATRNIPQVLQVNRHTYAAVRNALRDSRPNEFLLIAGGDHSLAIGTLGGITDSCKRLGIIWIDAHADFNTPITSPSGNIHGMSLAIACGHGHREFRAIAEYDPMVEEADVYQLGCRDVDPGEVENLAETKVTWLRMDAWRKAGLVKTAVDAVRKLGAACDHVHLSFDIDVIDPALVPGTGTPVGGGLSAVEARELLSELGKLGVFKSAEIVEYNPSLDAKDRRTGILTRDLIVTFVSAMK